MAPSGILRVFLLLTVARLTVVEPVMVIVGHPFEFPFTCNRGQSGSLMHLSEDGIRSRVAGFRSGEWKPVGEYRGRIRENFSRIVFTWILYTDGGGIYEMTCGETELQPVQLQVVFAAEVSVTRGETALLPCYFNIKPGSSVHWIKDGIFLCELKSGSGVYRGTADRRLSVSPDWSSHGNLSLILDQAQPEDQGDYFCFIQDGPSNNQSGSPAAVRLEVRDTENQTRTTLSPEVRDTENQTRTTLSPEVRDTENQTRTTLSPEQMKPWVIVIITVIATLPVVASCCFLLGWRLHACRSKVTSETRARGSSSQMETLFSSPAAAQVNGGQIHV